MNDPDTINGVTGPPLLLGGVCPVLQSLCLLPSPDPPCAGTLEREKPQGKGRADSGTLTWARHTVTEAHDTPVVVTRGDGHTSVLALGLEGDSIAQEDAAQQRDHGSTRAHGRD
jgi:hypothetical protein